MRFFDASAIVKRYLHEAASQRVRRLLISGDVIVSRLSELEVASSISRRARDGELTGQQYDRLIATLLEDLASWEIVEVTEAVTSAARRLSRTHPLRPADAMQLASALVAGGQLRATATEFVAFDERLLNAARAEGLTVIDS